MSSPPILSFEQDLARRVLDNRSNLSSNDRKIIEYLRNNSETLAFLTSASLSKEAGVSQAAIIRFAHRLGYTGFKEMREKARGDLRSDGQSPAERFAASGAQAEVENRYDRDVENLLTTQRLIESALAPAAYSVAQASSVYVIGDRDSLPLAMFLQRRLNMVREKVYLLDPGYPDVVCETQSTDAFVACTFKRYSRLTVRLLALARQRGASTVIVTDGERQDFLSESDHVLVALTDSFRFYWSMVAPIAVLESLVSEVAAQHPQVARARLAAKEDFTSEQRFFL